MFGSGPQPPSPFSRMAYGLPTTPAGQTRERVPDSTQGTSANRIARESGAVIAAKTATRNKAKGKRTGIVCASRASNPAGNPQPEAIPARTPARPPVRVVGAGRGRRRRARPHATRRSRLSRSGPGYGPRNGSGYTGPTSTARPASYTYAVGRRKDGGVGPQRAATAPRSRSPERDADAYRHENSAPGSEGRLRRHRAIPTPALEARATGRLARAPANL